MGKLIFEDDSNTQHEIKIDTIKTKNITSDDVILANYEVGDIKDEYKDLASKALTQLKTMLEEVMPEGVKVVVVATRNGKKDVNIKVLKNKAEKFESE